MMHDHTKVDGVAIHMQILNTTRAKTRSRDMGQAYKLSEVLPRVKTPLSGIWGEFDRDDATVRPEVVQRSHRPPGFLPAHVRKHRTVRLLEDLDVRPGQLAKPSVR